MCGKYFKRKHRIGKQMQISISTFWFLVEDIKIPDIFLQNAKVFKNVMGFKNHTQRSTLPNYLDVDKPFEFLSCHS